MLKLVKSTYDVCGSEHELQSQLGSGQQATHRSEAENIFIDIFVRTVLRITNIMKKGKRKTDLRLDIKY